MAPDRLGEVLDATYECLARYGVKRTTMEDIAAAAGLSRSALYQYVRNKDDAFRRLAARFHDRALAIARAAVETPEPATVQIAAVLTAKLNLVLDLAGGSPHTVELLDAKGRLFADICQQFSDEIRALLVGLFARTGSTSATPEEAADICLALIVGLEGRPDAAHLLPLAMAAVLRGLLLEPEPVTKAGRPAPQPVSAS